MEHPDNVQDYFLYQVPPILKISWKSILAISVMFLTYKQTNQQKWKHNLCGSEEVITEGSCDFLSQYHELRG